MAFKTRLLTDIPQRTPDVEIIFNGQLLLRSEDGVSCEVGINPLAANHVLTVEARTKTANQPDVIHMRQVGPLNFRLPGMTIEVTQPDFSAAWKCVGPGAIDHRTGTAGTAAPVEDFRWILDLESDLFHDKKLRPSVFGTQHVIKLQGGEYFFRTGVRASDRLKYVRTNAGINPNPIELKQIGAIARASVFLAQGQVLFVRWNDGTRERALPLPKPPANSIHEIYVQNTPLFLDPDDVVGHDELGEFYNVIPEIAPAARFALRPVKVVVGSDAGTPTIPCQVMTLDRPTE